MLEEEILKVKDVLNEMKNGMRGGEDELNLAFVKHDKFEAIINRTYCDLKSEKTGMPDIKESMMIVKKLVDQLP